MKRTKSFKQDIYKPVTISDARFGIRRIFLNTQDKPSIKTYKNPGRNWWGTK